MAASTERLEKLMDDGLVGEILEEIEVVALATIASTKGRGWSKKCRQRRKEARRALKGLRKLALEGVIPKNKVYGLYDTVDKCWIGDQDGADVLRYTDPELGRLAASVMNVRLQYPHGRIRSIMLHGVKDLHIKDYVEPPVSAEEALRRLEEGSVV